MTEGFPEFLRERRERAERTRRLLVIALGVACVTPAVSNVILALRLSALRAPAAVEAPAPSASIPSRAEAPPVTLPATRDSAIPSSAESAARPEAAEPRTASPPAQTPPAAPTPSRVRDGARPGMALPPRPLAGSVTARTVPRASSEPMPAPAAPEQATAAWMLTTYGRADAEARARAALAFYDAQSAEGRYWRRVLDQIAAAR